MGALAGGLLLLLLLPLSAGAATFAGGQVTFTFSTAFKSELKAAKVKVSVGGSATASGGTITVPLGEGFGDMASADTGLLRADKDATITFKRGSKKVVEGRLKVESDATDNLVEILGRSKRESRALFLTKTDTVTPFPGFFGLKGTGSAVLTETFADLLDVRLKTDAFGKGDGVGTWALPSAPRSLLFTGNSSLLTLNTTTAGKLLFGCGVGLTVDHPASAAGAGAPAGSLQFPVAGGIGNVSPVTSGLSKDDKKPTEVDLAGGIDLTKSGSTSLHLDRFHVRIKGDEQVVSASINGSKRVNIADLDKSNGPPTIALTATAGTVFVPGQVKIRGEVASTINANFGCTGGAALAAGDSLGTANFGGNVA